MDVLHRKHHANICLLETFSDEMMMVSSLIPKCLCTKTLIGPYIKIHTPGKVTPCRQRLHETQKE